MAKSTPDTIVLVGDPIYWEGLANGTPTPGHLAEFGTTADDFEVHGTAGGNAAPMFFVEDDIKGSEITTNYVDNNQCKVAFMPPGGCVYAILADGENAAIGDYLMSNGNGELKEFTADDATSPGENTVIAVATEAVDASDSAATAVASRRIKVAIL